jgi:hypothetical protein
MTIGEPFDMAHHKGRLAHTKARADQTSRLTAMTLCLLSSYSSITIAELCFRPGTLHRVAPVSVGGSMAAAHMIAGATDEAPTAPSRQVH